MRVHPTLVDVFSTSSHPCAVGTEAGILGCARRWARLALRSPRGCVPVVERSAAARRLADQHRGGLTAFSLLGQGVAVVFSRVETGSSTVIQTVAVGTQAPEAADRVVAMAVPADVLHLVAFVHIDAAVSVHGLLEASITHALDATSCVDAHPVLAHVVVFALVHVCKTIEQNSVS